MISNQGWLVKSNEEWKDLRGPYQKCLNRSSVSDLNAQMNGSELLYNPFSKQLWMCLWSFTSLSSLLTLFWLNACRDFHFPLFISICGLNLTFSIALTHVYTCKARCKSHKSNKVCELQISSNSRSGTEQKNQHFCTTLIEGFCHYLILIHYPGLSLREKQSFNLD